MNSLIDKIYDQLKADEDKARLKAAYNFAIKAHKGQFRQSGDKYSSHPIAVAARLWQLYQDLDLTIAGLLHDTIEDCEEVAIENIYKKFGPVAGFLVDSVTKRRGYFYQHEEIIEDHIERLLWAGQKDVRVILLKLADREHNIGTVDHVPEHKQVRMAFETQAIYEPLRRALNFGKVSSVKTAAKRYHSLLANYHNADPKALKEKIFGESFKNFKTDLFNEVYTKSHNVTWEITDRKLFDSLCRDESFAKNTQLSSLWTDGKNFKAHFRFLGAKIIEGARLEVASYYQ